jgi:hypothetical protein
MGTRAMCVLSRAPLYGLLSSEGGISTVENAWPSRIKLKTSDSGTKLKDPHLLPIRLWNTGDIEGQGDLLSSVQHIFMSEMYFYA